MRFSAPAVALASLVLWFARVSAAEDSALALHWVLGPGAERCVTENVLKLQLSESLAASPNLQHNVLVEGLIEKDTTQGGYRAYFHVVSASGRLLGTREIFSREQDCARVTPSILLVLSVLSELAIRPREPESSSPQSYDTERLKLAAQDVPTKSWELQPMAATGFALGMSPATSFGLLLGTDVQTPWPLMASLRAMYWPAGQTDITRTNGQLAAVGFNMFQAELAACLPIVAPSDFRFGVCWGATLLARHVRLYGLEDQQPSLRATVGTSAALRLAYAVSERWNVQLAASLIGLFRRDRYVYADPAGDRQLVYRGSALAAALTLGIGTSL